jgi:hypothetical protein
VADRSLDEFVGADADAGSDPAEDDREQSTDDDDGRAGDDDGPDGDGETVATSDAEPAPTEEGETARSTHGHSPTGADCERCGTTVRRRWRASEGDAMVCGDCKEW